MSRDLKLSLVSRTGRMFYMGLSLSLYVYNEIQTTSIIMFYITLYKMINIMHILH